MMLKKWALIIFTLTVLSTIGQPVHGEEQTVFGPNDFQIGAWHICLSRQTFGVDIPGDGYIAVSKTTPKEQINGGFLFFNRRLIPLRQFLTGSDIDFYKDVQLKEQNRLTVFLRGTPGASIKIQIKHMDHPIPPPEIAFSIDPPSILSNESTSLSWDVFNADTVTIDNGIGNVSPSGAMSVWPQETKTYHIVAIGPGGTASDSATVTVSPVPPTVDLSAVPEIITYGESSTLWWSSTDADNCVIDPDIDVVDVNGSRVVSPAETTTYTIAAEGPGGEVMDYVTVTVIDIPPTAIITANPDSINWGDRTILSWTCTNAEICMIEPDIGSVGPTGVFAVSPTETTTYTLTATGSAGTVSASVTINVTFPAPMVSISSNPEAIVQGEAGTLTWTSDHANNCFIEPAIGTVDLDGSVIVYPFDTTEYTITATGQGGSATDSVTLTVYQSPTVNINTSAENIMLGQSADLSWSSSYASFAEIDQGIGAVPTGGTFTVWPVETTKYNIIVSGNGGIATDSVTITVTYPVPTVNISANPNDIVFGESTTLSWSTTHTDSCIIEPDIGSVDLNGSVDISPSETITYIITATGPGGIDAKSITIQVSVPSNPPIVDLNVSPITTPQGGSATLSWSSSNGQFAHIDNGIGAVSVIGSTVVNPTNTTTYTITVTGPAGSANAQGTVMVTGNPAPQPEVSFGAQYEDLIPPDATVERYDPKRFSLITGLVQGMEGAPIPGVAITIHKHPEYGTAYTDVEGRFSIPTEGGDTMTIEYRIEGMITAHRKIYVPWNETAITETIQMTAEDPLSTTVTFDGDPATIVTHKSTEVTDAFGSRSCTMVYSGDNLAYLVDENGNDVHALTTITTRATEFVTPESMPAILPPTSAYTYCAELSVDGTERVRFEKPIITWVDNFLNFKVGDIVPSGYFDRERGIWVPSENGLVVKLLDTNADGMVDSLDADGDDQPDDLNETCNIESEGGSLCFSDDVIGLGDPLKYPVNSTFWRVPVTHFSSWDYNWPCLPPMDATPPNPLGEPSTNDQKEDPCYNLTGSEVESRTHIFHEDIHIPGTTVALHYTSNRVEGYKTVISVPASGSEVPSSLKRIIVRIEVAGRILEQVIEPLPNQKTNLVWDGLDYLGNEIKSSVTAHVRIGFVYDLYYADPSPDSGPAFGQPGFQVSDIPARQEGTLWKYSNIMVTPPGARLSNHPIAKGWSLSKHHHLDTNPYFHELNKGDGEIEKGNHIIIRTLAGNGVEGYSGDDGPAIDASFSKPYGIAVDGSGNIYIADTFNHRIRKVGADGIINTIAGNGSGGYSTDGSLAIDASISFPHSINIDSSGSIYFTDYYCVIRKVDTNGIISTVAGNRNNGCGYTGDAVPATDACLSNPYDIAVDNSGNLYVSDTGNHRIRKVDTSGIISTVAGNGIAGFSGDGGPATEASIENPNGITVDSFGNIYFSDYVNKRIRKVDSAGIISTVAGNGISEYSGDGGPAIYAGIGNPWNVEVDSFGNVYIADRLCLFIRKVDTSGIISTVAGNGIAEFSGDGGPATEASLNHPLGLAVDSAGNIYIADTWNNRIRKVGPSPLYSGAGPLDGVAFADSSGLGYIMDINGLHKKTIDLSTGLKLCDFNYNSEGQLIAITDQFGSETSIQRYVDGTPFSITSPDGLVTELSVNSSNHLQRITFPDGGYYDFQNASNGLLTTKTAPAGNQFTYSYDESGRVIGTTDQHGGHWVFSKVLVDQDEILAEVITGEENLTSYLDRTYSTGAFTATITDPTGAKTLFSQSADGLNTNKSLPCGMDLQFTYDLDSEYRFKYVSQMRESTPSLLEKFTLRNKNYQDMNGDDVPDLMSETVTVNTKTTTLEHDVLQSQKAIISPEGRTVTTLYDPNTLLTERVSVPGLFDTVYEYDARGRLIFIISGARETSYVYNSQGFLESVTDPENHTTSYTYDLVGRVTGINRPDATSIGFSYDANGNMTVITNPSDVEHALGYNAVNLKSSYTTPVSGSYSYVYDKDRRLIQTDFPSGKKIINSYANGRVEQVQTPEGDIDFSYLCGTKVASISNDSETITYEYDGKLVTSEALNGILDQTLSYTYNNDFNVTEFTYAGDTVSYSHDGDGLLTAAGNFTVTRNAQNGLPEAVTDGAMSLDRTFNGYGEIEEQNIAVDSQGVSTWTLTRDNKGRIISRAETVGGVTARYDYEYDEMGRLLSVYKDGTLAEEYGYDTIPYGTCTYQMSNFRGITDRILQYDDEDKLLSVDGTTYQYNLDGFLTTKTIESDITNYTYSSRGELLSVTLPDSTLIQYVYDPLGRRIAKKINGTFTQKYLWQGLTRLLAIFDDSGNLLQRFDYADGRMPVAMTEGGATYYLTYDSVESLRLVADALGNVVKRIDYDSFGNIISDSNPEFQMPFGFAGGLHDGDTGLVRFGARDYDPDVGRWTAKDPIFFDGGDTDLYGYCLYDPVNFVDHLGLEFYASANAGFAGFDYSTTTQNFYQANLTAGSGVIIGGGFSFGYDFGTGVFDNTTHRLYGSDFINIGIGKCLGISFAPDFSKVQFNIGIGLALPLSYSALIRDRNLKPLDVTFGDEIYDHFHDDPCK